jgi:signal peptidase I
MSFPQAPETEIVESPARLNGEAITPETPEAPRRRFRAGVRALRPRLRRPGLLRELLNNLFFIAAALVLSEIAFPRSSISGPSMQPTLWAGQHLLISRVDYLFGEPQYLDIAVFDPPDTSDDMLIKRVIGLPGDTIEIRDQLVYRNGQLLDEPYFVNAPCEPYKCPDKSWTLGENEYFMMGDNRNHSNDSRAFGPIHRQHIVGKALWRYLPLNQFGSLYSIQYNSRPVDADTQTQRGADLEP